MSEEVLRLLEMAYRLGFFQAAEISVFDLSPREEVRQMCRMNVCGFYGRNWACPPHCGSLGLWREKIAAFSAGILVQSVGALSDPFDGEGMLRIEAAHKKRFEAMTALLAREKIPFLAIGTGTCTRCGTCTCPDAPCRFGAPAVISMEAAGLLVSELVQKSGLCYYFGPERIGYVSCVLIRERDGWKGETDGKKESRGADPGGGATVQPAAEGTGARRPGGEDHPGQRDRDPGECGPGAL